MLYKITDYLNFSTEISLYLLVFYLLILELKNLVTAQLIFCYNSSLLVESLVLLRCSSLEKIQIFAGPPLLFNIVLGDLCSCYSCLVICWLSTTVLQRMRRYFQGSQISSCSSKKS